MDPSWSSKALGTLSDQQYQFGLHAQRRLMAPCCYTQTIDVHSSDIAETMRQEVLHMVRSGTEERLAWRGGVRRSSRAAFRDSASHSRSDSRRHGVVVVTRDWNKESAL